MRVECNKMTYNMCIDQARHDEFARGCAKIHDIVLAVFQATCGDNVMEDEWIDVLFDPDDVAIQTDCDQAARECGIVCQ